MTDLAKLKELAEAVHETWIKCDRGDYGDYDGNCNIILDKGHNFRIAAVFDEDDAAFIAAANPAAILALISRLEEAEKALAPFADIANRYPKIDRTKRMQIQMRHCRRAAQLMEREYG